MIFKKQFKLVLVLMCVTTLFSKLSAQELFPDGTAIPAWFSQNNPTDISKLGKQYRITDNQVRNDSTLIQTKNIQAVIDKRLKMAAV